MMGSMAERRRSSRLMTPKTPLLDDFPEIAQMFADVFLVDLADVEPRRDDPRGPEVASDQCDLEKLATVLRVAVAGRVRLLAAILDRHAHQFQKLAAEETRTVLIAASWADEIQDTLSSLGTARNFIAKALRRSVDKVDALVKEGSAALVFEAKAKFLKEELVSGNEYVDFVDHLREKYVSPRNAVWQLAKSTSALSSRAWLEILPEFEETTEIFPIVVTTTSAWIAQEQDCSSGRK